MRLVHMEVMTLTLVLLNKLRCHAHFKFQPVSLLDLDCCYKFTYLMANNADPDQLADLDLHCLQRLVLYWFIRTRVKMTCMSHLQHLQAAIEAPIRNIADSLLFVYPRGTMVYSLLFVYPRGTMVYPSSDASWSGSTLFANLRQGISGFSRTRVHTDGLFTLTDSNLFLSPQEILRDILWKCSYFILKIYVLNTLYNCLIEAISMSTLNIPLFNRRWKRLP